MQEMSQNECGFSIREWLRVTVLGRKSPSRLDYCGGNWLRVQVHIHDNNSQVEFEDACLRTDEIRRLRGAVQGLLEGKNETVSLEPIESKWSITLTKPDGRGHFVVQFTGTFWRRGRACSTEHRYEFGIDQTDLQILEKQLFLILQDYPVVGEK